MAVAQSSSQPVAEQWQIAATGAQDVTVLLVLAVAIGVGVVWTYRSLDPQLRKSIRLGITALRALALGVCLCLLMQPSLRFRTILNTPAHLAILVDVSGSMNSGGTESRLNAARVLLERAKTQLRDLEKRFNVSWFRFAETPTEVRDARESTEPPAEKHLSSNLCGSLEQVLERFTDEELAGVVLLSDGADTERPLTPIKAEDVAFARAHGVPVNTVLLSSTEHRKDLAIAEVKVDPIAFSRSEAPIRVDVKSIGIPDREVEVILWQDGSVVQRRVVQIIGGAGQANFAVAPSRLGPHVMTVTVPVPPEDKLPENNRAYLSFKVVRDKIRVLHLVGHPSWDQRMLRDTLTAWPLVDLVSFYILRTAYQSSTYGSSGLALIPFPRPQTIFEKHLDEFDIVVFQDFKPVTVWHERHMQRVVDFVERGGAVVVIGGTHGLRAGGPASSILQRILPLRLLPRKTPKRRQNDLASFRLNLTPVGFRHPITRLKTDIEENKRLWRSLARLDGANRVLGLAQGALSLAEHPHAQVEDGALPIIAVKETGKGRALAITTDALWRWRFSGPLGGGPLDTYADFWHRAVSWLTRDPELDTLRVQITPSPVPKDQPARIEFELLNEAYLPVPGVQLNCTVSWLGKDGVKAYDNFSIRLNDQGRYSLKWRPKVDGPHRLTVTGENGVSAATRFLVQTKNKELSRLDANEPLLKAIAEASTGHHQQNELKLDELQTRVTATQKVLSRVDIPIWDRPWAIGVFILLLALEWVLRRRVGLL